MSSFNPDNLLQNTEIREGSIDHKSVEDVGREYLLTEEARVDKLAIKEVVQGNISRDVFRSKFSTLSPDKVTGNAFLHALIRVVGVGDPKSRTERLRLFRGAIEYFSEERDITYELGHACGSDALKGIITSGAITPGGTGEHGEAIHFSYDRDVNSKPDNAAEIIKGSHVSVAEMDHPAGFLVEEFYARLAANRELTDRLLQINAFGEGAASFAEECLTWFIEAMPDRVLAEFCNQTGLDKDAAVHAIAKEQGVLNVELSGAVLAKSTLVRAQFAKVISELMRRVHFKTEEGEARDFQAYQQIFDDFNNGVFPTVTINGKSLSDPAEILAQGNILDVDTVDEKICKELYNNYHYLIASKNNPNTITVDELRAHPEIYLPPIIDWIARPGGQYSRLLHPLPGDTPDSIQNKERRLYELAHQFPAIIIIDGAGVRQQGKTHRQLDNGRAPLEDLPTEERVYTAIPTTDFREIFVPQKMIAEVDGWLKENGVEGVRVVPMEYLEVRRIVEQSVFD